MVKTSRRSDLSQWINEQANRRLDMLHNYVGLLIGALTYQVLSNLFVLLSFEIAFHYVDASVKWPCSCSSAAITERLLLAVSFPTQTRSSPCRCIGLWACIEVCWCVMMYKASGEVVWWICFLLDATIWWNRIMQKKQTHSTLKYSSCQNDLKHCQRESSSLLCLEGWKTLFGYCFFFRLTIVDGFMLRILNLKIRYLVFLYLDSGVLAMETQLFSNLKSCLYIFVSFGQSTVMYLLTLSFENKIDLCSRYSSECIQNLVWKLRYQAHHQWWPWFDWVPGSFLLIW